MRTATSAAVTAPRCLLLALALWTVACYAQVTKDGCPEGQTLMCDGESCKMPNHACVADYWPQQEEVLESIRCGPKQSCDDMAESMEDLNELKELIYEKQQHGAVCIMFTKVGVECSGSDTPSTGPAGPTTTGPAAAPSTSPAAPTTTGPATPPSTTGSAK